MSASRALLDSSREQLRALAARSSDSLSGFLINQVLATCLGRPPEDNLLRRRIVINGDGRVLGALLEDGRPSLAARNLLGFSPLGRVARALLAADVLAIRVGTLPRRSEGGIAVVTDPVNAHADWLLNSQSLALGRMPFTWLNLQAVPLGQLPCPLLMNLEPRDLLSLKWWLLRLLRSLSSCRFASVESVYQLRHELYAQTARYKCEDGKRDFKNFT